MPYSKIKLISFDLDNTLYDNGPVIKLAERKSQVFLQSEFDKQGQVFDFQEFINYRKKLVLSEEHLGLSDKSRYENLSFLRKIVLRKCCKNLSNSAAIVEQALEIFLNYRNRVKIEISVIAMLQQLKQRYILVSVTNGNCDAAKLSIGSSFSKSYSPTLGYRAKPHPEMLEQVFEDFELQPDQVLHVGDEMDSDGQAAILAGCRFKLFSPFDKVTIFSKTCNELIAELSN